MTQSICNYPAGAKEAFMRFGAFVPQGWRFDLANIPVGEQWASILDVARQIEQDRFESLWVYDHFHTNPSSQESTFEAWTLMAAFAATTSTVRLGQMCTCNAYRSPAYLAKVAASIDVISGGRLEMGIGAGWYEHEFLGYGYEFLPAGVRLGQLGEAVQIILRMWNEDRVDFEGRHYGLWGAICRPKPLQQPQIPLWIAGGGERTTLRIAARHATCTNFGRSLEEFGQKSEALARHCHDLDRDFDQIVRSSNFDVAVAPSEAEVKDRLSWIDQHYRLFLSDKQEQPSKSFRRHGLVGTPEQIVERLQEWMAAGMTYAICYFPEAAYDPSGLRLFAEEVIPALR
jgi:F420-dependent oxidoreductase-like protein